MHKMMMMIVVTAFMNGVMAYGQDKDPVPVEVEYVEGGILIKLDMMAGRNEDGEREQGWLAAVWEGTKENKWTIATGFAAAVVTEMITSHNDYLWHKKDKPKAAAAKPAADDPAAAKPDTKPTEGGTTQTTDDGGDNNSSDINIETGDNSPVVITINPEP